METIDKIRKGELAICDTGTHGQLLNAMDIIWPDYEVRPPDGGLGIYYFSNTRGQWRSESDPMRLYPTILGSVPVPDFLKECRAWEEKHIETKRPEKPEEIAKDQHKAFENKSGLFSGIGNPKPQDIHVGGPNSVHRPDTIMDTIRKIGSGEIVFKRDGSFEDLARATLLVHPNFHLSYSRWNDWMYYHANMDLRIWHNIKELPNGKNEITVSDFLERIEKETSVTKIGHQSENDVPEIENWEQAYNQAFELLKKAASNMGKTVRVELEDKVKFEVQYLSSYRNTTKSMNVAFIDKKGRNVKMYDLFLERKDQIMKAIEDILNDDQS